MASVEGDEKEGGEKRVVRDYRGSSKYGTMAKEREDNNGLDTVRRVSGGSRDNLGRKNNR